MWPDRGIDTQVCQSVLTQLSLLRAALRASLQVLCTRLVHTVVNGTQCYPLLWQLGENPLRDSNGQGGAVHQCRQNITLSSQLFKSWEKQQFSPFVNLSRGFLNSMLSDHTWPASWVTRCGIIWFLQCLQQNDFIIKVFPFSSTTSDFARVLCF